MPKFRLNPPLIIVLILVITIVFLGLHRQSDLSKSNQSTEQTSSSLSNFEKQAQWMPI